MEHFKITAGKYQKKSFTIEKFPKTEIFWRYDREPNFRAMKFTKNKNFEICCPELTQENRYVYIEADIFTAKLITNIYVDYLKATLNIPNVNTITGFACGNSYYLITEQSSDITDIIPINKRMHIDDADSVLKQIVIQYYLLSTYNFTLGSPDLYALRFTLDPITYKVKNKEYSFNFLVSVICTNFTTININNQRIYAGTILSRKKLERLNYSRTIQTREYVPEDCINLCNPELILTYTLSPENAEIYLQTRRSGIPLFNNSFDLYAILFSLMSYKPFYDVIQEKQHKIWKLLWLPDQLAIIESRVKKYHGGNPATINDIIIDLQGINLKCKIFEILVKYYKLTEN